MKLVVGLGNPGRTYAQTRHNLGFRVVEALARRCGLRDWRRRFHSLAVEGILGGQDVMLMKPETYVNESGRAVRAAVDWCRLDPQDVLVVCDDFNLPLGRLRVRGRGSSGGHKGLESVLQALGSQEVSRLRVGIGAEGAPRDRDFVLSRFAPEERDMVEEAIERAARAVEVWVEFGLERCQNEFNRGPALPEEAESPSAARGEEGRARDTRSTGAGEG